MITFIAAAIAFQTGAKHSDVNLLCSNSTIVEGKPFVVAFDFKVERNWHIYWRNPGDSGQEPRVKWQAPKGWTISSLRWPAPKLRVEGDINTYVYEGRVTLLATIVPHHISGRTKLKARVDWLVCSDVCLPQAKSVDVTVTAGPRSIPTPSAAKIASAEVAAKRKLIRGGEGRMSAGDIMITVPRVPAGSYEFFPYQGDLVKAGNYHGESDGHTLSFKLTKSQYFNAKSAYVDGVLVPRASKMSQADASLYEIGVPLLKN